MKKYTLLAILIVNQFSVYACDICQKKQPKWLQGISHRAGPEDNWEYWIVSFMAIITLYSLIATIRCFFKAGKEPESHIKNIIINQNA